MLLDLMVIIVLVSRQVLEQLTNKAGAMTWGPGPASLADKIDKREGKNVSHRQGL